MSTREKIGAESRIFSDDSRTDLTSVLTWSPIRFGRVLPMMMPIFFGAASDMFAVVRGVVRGVARSGRIMIRILV